MGFWGYFVFDTVPDRWTIAGASIIAASGMFIWMRERKLARKHIPARAYRR